MTMRRSLTSLSQKLRGQASAEEPDTLRCGDLTIDVPRHVVSWRGKEIELTATEFKLLTVLAHEPAIRPERARASPVLVDTDRLVARGRGGRPQADEAGDDEPGPCEPLR